MSTALHLQFHANHTPIVLLLSNIGTPASSTTKTGRHYIAEILLKVALNTINQIKSLCLWLISTTQLFYMGITPAGERGGGVGAISNTSDSMRVSQ